MFELFSENILKALEIKAMRDEPSQLRLFRGGGSQRVKNFLTPFCINSSSFQMALDYSLTTVKPFWTESLPSSNNLDKLVVTD